MITLSDGLYLYHGSYTSVEKIDLEKCVPYKDFGRGFYVITSLEQAKSFVRLSMNKARMRGLIDSKVNRGYVSIYRLDYRKCLKVKYFREADPEWLHFVVANRNSNCFPGLLESYKDYNVIVGKIANDRTAATLQGYMENAYGEVGTKEADERAIAVLLPNKLEDQICFRTNESVAALHFSRIECYEP